MNKKLLSLIMAVAMIATLAMPTLAAEGTGSGDFEYGTSTNTPTVTVAMPTSASITLNPYGMAVTVGSDSVTDQIISATQHITNNTPSPMKVGVVATFIKSGDVVYSAKPCTGKETTKNAFLLVEFANTAATTDEPTWITDITSGDTMNEKCYPQIIPTEQGKAATGIMSVPAASTTTANYIAIKVFGNLSSAPTEAWKSSDKATVKLEFTFTPSVLHNVTVPSGVTAKSTITPSGSDPTQAVMGAIVRLEAANGKQPTAKDANNNAVTVTKVTDTLYYFTMPATDVTVTAGA
jgi:hypothetical protein